MELKLSGLGAIPSKWGSIRIMVDDGWGEMAPGTWRVKLTHHKRTSACTYTERHPLTHFEAGKHKQRLLAGNHSITNRGHSIAPTGAI